MKWVFLSWVLAASSVGAGDAQLTWQRVIGLLQYLEGDYGAAQASGDAAELAEQRGLADEVVQALKGEAGALYLTRAQAILASIEAAKPAAEVAGLCRALAQDIIMQQQVVQAPKQPPDIEAGAALFRSQCAQCHGQQGDGQSPMAATMTPKPANFHDAQRMQVLTPYKVFNTTTFGISGTPMPAFSALSDGDRWNLAFFVFSLRQPPCAEPRATSRARLDELATMNDEALGQLHGAAHVACLRRVMPTVTEQSSLGLAIAGVHQAVAFSKANRHDDARKAIVDAYLTGVEPVEPTLRARDAALVGELERAFTAARLTAQRGGDLEADSKVLLAALQKAAAPSSVGDFWSVFITALLIILREGFEAAVVVGALLAVLKKMGAVEQSRVVHYGWASALISSAVAYVFGQKLLAGANREWMETLVSLFAVGMLLYAALWLNARANVSKFMGELREKMKGAVGSGNLAGLFLISFTSVGRETLETALFLEGLAGDSPRGAAWGAIAGLGVLSLFLVLVRKVGFVLPMKTLFKASTVLLIATAVMLIGKGFHGLQELGVLPIAPVSFVTVSALGIFADGVSLAPQVVLALAPLGWWLLRRARRAS